MKYFIDSEFIEDGRTIELISLAIVAEDGREFYRQNADCSFGRASEWVWRNVFPHLQHFAMRGKRSCNAREYHGGGDTHTGRCAGHKCPWAYHWEIRDAVLNFCDIGLYGNPEFWGYYADYDWVAFCQLVGTMASLPKGFPMYCRDIQQLREHTGIESLPPHLSSEHSAMNDARWNKLAYEFLTGACAAASPHKTPHFAGCPAIEGKPVCTCGTGRGA